MKKDWQAAWLLRAIACMDLTTLSGDDSAERVKRLCAKAKRPVQDHLVKVQLRTALLPLRLKFSHANRRQTKKSQKE